ncbi:gamma-glutamylputrescine synthetase PuuA [Variibacter gotjawalensis]|uniref:Gamma-glutamylputrescine synthetase PuuA n=1 Tax=Variibacter gotjawalensis TaxID=1333996 RepID=A0A0S3PZE4_9BRAD|nr:glutamine synthetase [Variibacter gotjawalensis]NIK47131.1 glutamine synthetase [Variibacter gotjawalensis]RZS49033.1 glutamine synthetase [Variibacter gotjawalensis]BAT61293.1 gamma-glutamylputrescine synthetase PuuA [Variibacter gotjawalensis]
MQPEEVKTAAQARKIVESRGLSHVKVGVFDIDGILRGKYMSREKFFSALESGFGFCDVVLGWDSNDQLYDNVSYTGWHTAYPDAQVRVLPGTCRAIPTEGNMLLFLGEFAGEAEAVCPRGVLRRVLQRAEKKGYSAIASAEFEFFLFDETPTSVREKGYRDLKTTTPGFFGYSMLRASVQREFYEELLALCGGMRMPLEGLHTETGPGVIEAAITYSGALEAADRGALFKTYTKILAQRSGKLATFMAKWSRDWPGQSGHLHVSLQDKRAKPVFHHARNPNNISDEMRWFIGGQQALMPELLSMAAPTVNSYTRLIPGFWAPTEATWGVENRTCAIRAIPGSPKSQRVEYRVTAADINPYIAFAAAIGSGLWGIENKIEPDAPIEGNAYNWSQPAKRRLPKSLGEAAERLKESDAARELFGEAFVEHYAATREWEEREYRKAVTDWQLARYFEII